MQSLDSHLQPFREQSTPLCLCSSSLNKARDRNVFLRELYVMVNTWFPKGRRQLCPFVSKGP